MMMTGSGDGDGGGGGGDGGSTNVVSGSRRPSRRAAQVKKYETAFMASLRAFHNEKKASGGKPLKMPVFCHVELDLEHVYNEVAKRGGYEAVTSDKRWLEVCRTLGHDLTGQTSAGFQMRVSYEKTLLDYELHVNGKAPRSVASGETVNAGGAAAGKGKSGAGRGVNGGAASGSGGSRSVGGGISAAAGGAFPGAVGTSGNTNNNGNNTTTSRPTPSARPRYKLSKSEEEKIARALGLAGQTCPDGMLEDLSPDEASFLFPGANEADYCNIRSSIVARWRLEPSLYLSVETACDWYIAKFRKLVHCAHRYLTTRGYINFGVGCISGRYLAPGASKGTVVVIGSGMAGLAAARQLMQMGHRVVVLEGRDRPGGRVWTRSLSGTDPVTGETHRAVGEMGGSILTGADSNPLCVLARQLDVTWHAIRKPCPLYTEGGVQVDETIDEKIYTEHNELLDKLGEARQKMGESQANVTSLGRSLNRLWRERDPSPTPEETDIFNWYLANLEFANACRLDTVSLGQWDQDDANEFTGEHVWVPGGNARLVGAMARHLPVFYNHTVTSVKYPRSNTEQPPNTTTNTGEEGETLEENIAVRSGGGGEEEHEDRRGKEMEEAGLAEPEEEKPEEGGDAEGRGGGTVEVTCANGRSFKADVALVTVPLGVLKRGGITFKPRLPERKIRSIANLGFGVLNKVILLFPTMFWDADHDTFGYVTRGSGVERRGNYFMFYSYAPHVSGGAVLVALVAGDAAVDFEDEEKSTDVDNVAGAMRVLREIFEPQGKTVPDPLDTACTRWGSDPFAYGSYSSISVDATGDDYDVLAEPVGRNLHFAGEATCRTHPATMHGAFLSGLRAAAVISDTLRGMNKRGELVREEKKKKNKAGVGGGGAAGAAAAGEGIVKNENLVENVIGAGVLGGGGGGGGGAQLHHRGGHKRSRDDDEELGRGGAVPEEGIEIESSSDDDDSEEDDSSSDDDIPTWDGVIRGVNHQLDVV